ncbi:GNAT family N-acetyltransferase [Virgibacillus necropolis]|uniref:GNAT family N-acetyltransferase n=1 Tax=Virgibacillus necropolis TaxID=163877 RepID=UPI00384D1B97
MNLHFENDAEKYSDLVEPLLLKKEACNNLMLGLLNRIAEGRSVYKDVFLGYVEEDGEVIFAFMQTPPNNWIFPDVDSIEEGVPKAIAGFLRDNNLGVPGILGPETLVKPFVEEWERLNDVLSSVHMKQLIYQLDEVNSVPQTDGDLVEAHANDYQLISEWLVQFGRKVNEATTKGDAENLATQFLNNRSAYFWKVNGKPVSMINRSRSTKNGATVNAVFTPDEHKRKGYATSSVAAFTSKLLRDGANFCSLYTDADYPTSNRIYKKIGYYEVGTSVVYEFNSKK